MSDKYCYDSCEIMRKICDVLGIDPEKKRPIRRILIDLQVDCVPKVYTDEFAWATPQKWDDIIKFLADGNPDKLVVNPQLEAGPQGVYESIPGRQTP